MAKENIIQTKSYNLAVDIILFCCKIQETKKEFIITKQLIKSGTSIGANIEEAQGAISKKEFISKLYISYKEARETKFWLRILGDTYCKNDNEINLKISEVDEIIKILTSILKSSKNNI